MKSENSKTAPHMDRLQRLAKYKATMETLLKDSKKELLQAISSKTVTLPGCEDSSSLEEKERMADLLWNNV